MIGPDQAFEALNTRSAFTEEQAAEIATALGVAWNPPGALFRNGAETCTRGRCRTIWTQGSERELSPVSRKDDHRPSIAVR